MRGNDVAAHRAAGEQEVVLTDFASAKPENIFSTGVLHFSPFTGPQKTVLWIRTDPAPDPALFVIDLQDVNQKLLFFSLRFSA